MSGLRNLDDNLIPISSLASFVYCERRYYLLNVECNNHLFGNHLTALGQIEHNTVHSNNIEKRGEFIKVHSMQVFSKNLGIIGQCDTVEFYKNSTASYIPLLEGNYDMVVVEHKRKELSISDCDVIQITAQTMCLEEMFNTKINISYIYYSQTNKKERFEITQTNRIKVKNLISQIHKLEKLQSPPPVKLLKSCKNCAAYDICSPKKNTVSSYMETLWRQL